MDYFKLFNLSKELTKTVIQLKALMHPILKISSIQS